jgi:hypothetical protein
MSTVRGGSVWLALQAPSHTSVETLNDVVVSAVCWALSDKAVVCEAGNKSNDEDPHLDSLANHLSENEAHALQLA